MGYGTNLWRLFLRIRSIREIKTMDILVHKDAVPVKILKKLHLK